MTVTRQAKVESALHKTKKALQGRKGRGEVKEKIAKMLLELPPGAVQDIIDYGSMAILIVASIICILLGKLVYKKVPICYWTYKIYVIAIDVIVLAFAFLYKYSKK